VSAAKHTPGPWECYPAGCFINEDGTAKTPPSEFHVDPVGIVLPVRGNTTRAEANARLIAAAPELLAAAELILRGYGVTFQDAALRGLLAEVVAKATGSAK
jgi:hypothetical protein